MDNFWWDCNFLHRKSVRILSIQQCIANWFNRKNDRRIKTTRLVHLWGSRYLLPVELSKLSDSQLLLRLCSAFIKFCIQSAFNKNMFVVSSVSGPIESFHPLWIHEVLCLYPLTAFGCFLFISWFRLSGWVAVSLPHFLCPHRFANLETKDAQHPTS